MSAIVRIFGIFKSMSIVVKTLSEQAYEIIRERILANAMFPAKPIRQDALSQDLGVSKIPLREALTRLEQDGLLVSQPNRGYIVRPLSLAEAEDVFQLRITLEPEAAAAGCKKANQEEQQKVTDLFIKLQSLAHEVTPEAITVNREFHLALCAPSGRNITLELLFKIHLLSERYVRRHLEPPENEGQAFTEHQLIYDAWMNKDSKEVAKLLKGHTQSTLEDLRGQLSE